MLPNFLRDRLFLTQLDKLKIKQQYVRITVLNWVEEPVAEVTGTIISGSLNLDGRSSMRRSGSLSIRAEEKENLLSNVEHLFSINKKCKIQLGIKNTVPNYIFTTKNEEGLQEERVIDYQQLYGDIVWFPLGIYVMFNPSISHSLSDVTISMNIKDKMCLLNGQIAGQIHSGVDFSTQGEDWDKDNDVETNPVLLVNIIRQLVNHWGNEALARIFVSDVPNQIRSVVRWNGEEKKYLVHVGSIFQMFDDFISADNYAIANGLNEKVCFETSSEYRNWEHDFIDHIKDGSASVEAISSTLATGFVYPYQPGKDIGYRYADFIWPDKNPLECNPGETVTSVLDKIISKIGNYEYFYDVEGNFIFQEKKNNLNTTNTAYWEREEYASGKAPIQIDPTGQWGTTTIYNLSLPWDAYDADYRRLTKAVYNFDDNRYITSFNNTLNYNNVKNDFLVWGVRKDSGIACRFHLAIDKIPELHVHRVIQYVDEYDENLVRAVAYVNRDEEGQPDYQNYNDSDYNYDYLQKVMKDYPSIRKAWLDNRLLHYGTREATDWREELYYQALQAAKTGIDMDTDINNNYAYYYAELIEEFPKIYDLRPILQAKQGTQGQESYVDDLFDTVGKQDVYDKDTFDVWKGRDKSLKFHAKESDKIICSHARGWKSEVFEHPENINYFIDFIDEDSELGHFCVRNIGRRPIIVGDSNSGANCVFEPSIPDIIYYHYNEEDQDGEYQTEYKHKHKDYESIRSFNTLSARSEIWYNIPDDETWDNFIVGGVLNSCYEVVKDLLYQHTHYNDSITISGLPIYYLEPGNRITVENKVNGIYGDYIIQSISLPLDINSTMNISAGKALQRI